jgi:hypothetical protein
MKKISGHTSLLKLHKQWIKYDLIFQLFIAIAIGILTVSLLSKFIPAPLWWAIPISLCTASITILWTGLLKKSARDLASLLDRSFPQLEESSSLLLKPAESLNLLEKLQLAKIEPELAAIKAAEIPSRRLILARNILIGSVIITFALQQLQPFSGAATQTTKDKNSSRPAPDKLLPGIRSLSLTIAPPAYTQKSLRRQDQFSVSAEEGSTLSWLIRTNQPARQIDLIFNDKDQQKLRPVNRDSTEWSLSKKVTSPGFYQVNLNGKLSDLYKLEIVKDQPALIRIVSPAQYSSIDFGEPQKTNVQVQINDDYGVTDAFISATISSGKGEGVKFKEQQIRFQQIFSGANQYRLDKSIDLASLGMIPGDELYFYVQARDSRLQDSRSDIYIVTIQDTAQLMSMEGMMGGVNLVPEYFRSQRQIIIDTEKLIKDKNIISSSDFKNRSNDIATDQKLLRLRYGKFLGEEDESEIGAHQDEDHPDDPADFGNAEKLLGAVSHKHDQAEDATFFEPAQKAQLKATLTEMWKAELQLRLYKPAEALPFEYKALRLLKDLQQQSRVYVAKTSFKPPPISPDKRLSGELDKVVQPQTQRNAAPKNDMQNALRLAPGIIDRVKTGAKLTRSDISTLREASQALAMQAAQQPSLYLNSLALIRLIIREGELGGISTPKIRELESALQRIIKPGSPLPQAGAGSTPGDLSAEYFNNLKRNR